jgi:hypothetical protein
MKGTTKTDMFRPLTEVSLNQKRINVCEHTVKFQVRHTRESDRKKGRVEEMEEKVNTRPGSRRQNDLISKFKMAVGDVISIMG